MKTFLENILEIKAKEVQEMPVEELLPLRKTGKFYDFVRSNADHIQLIAEVKRASPSKGDISLGVDVVAQAKSYQVAGAGAISVLTDPAFFKGSIEDLKQVAAVVDLPVLCKDFIIDKKQLIRARNAGATIVLLIVSALSHAQLEDLYQEAEALGLEILVEVHDQAELKIAEVLGARLIGVNNRNLHTFDVSLAVSEELGRYQNSPTAVYISESGFRDKTEVEKIKDKYQVVLVGEALMRDQNPTVAAEKLRVKR